MIRLLNQGRKWDNGDHLYMGKKLAPFDKSMLEGKDCLFLQYVKENVISAWQQLGSIDEFERYHCPYTSSDFYWAIPYAILSTDLKKYERHIPDYLRPMAFDQDWNKAQHFREFDDSPDLSRLLICTLGPGYTIGTSMHDGSAALDWATIQLSNGDTLICITNVWYNK